MKKTIEILQNIVSRKGSSKVLTFSTPHVFKALQLLGEDKYVSRATFGREIRLGEGAVKTLVSHLKEVSIIESTKSGSFLTEKGKRTVKQLQKKVPFECEIKKCRLVSGKHNHAIILKDYAYAIKSGLEQRDYAIMYGSSGCITILFKKNTFMFPSEDTDCFANDQKTKYDIIEKLHPENGDVIIISSSDDPFVAEISAKNSVLWTMATN